MRHPLFLFVLILIFVSPLALPAQEEDEAVAKLRDQLRKVMTQLRDAQGQIANAQAVKIQDDAKIADLTAKLERLTKQSAADKSTAEATIARLEKDNAAQDERNAKQVEALKNWKKSYDTLLAQAKQVAAKRDELSAQKIQADRRIADLQAKNDELYQLGTQILRRYERYGLGDAILNREPFTGIAKVKFQNYVQQNADRLTDNRAPTDGSATVTTTTTTATTKPTNTNATDR